MADGLFSYKTPGQLQQDYLGGLMQPVGGGDLYSQLIQTMSNAGRIAGYGAGRMFGGQVPGEEKNAAIQSVFEQVKGIADPIEQYNKAAELFAQSGFPDLAMQARKTAQQEQLTGLQLRKTTAETLKIEQELANQPDALQKFAELEALNSENKYTKSQLMFAAQNNKTFDAVRNELVKRPAAAKPMDYGVEANRVAATFINPETNKPYTSFADVKDVKTRQQILNALNKAKENRTTIELTQGGSALEMTQRYDNLVKTERQTLQAAKQSITLLNEAAQKGDAEGNVSAWNAARVALARAIGEGKLSNADIERLGGSAGLFLAVQDIVSKTFTGVPSLETQAQLYRVAKILELAKTQEINSLSDKARNIFKLDYPDKATDERLNVYFPKAPVPFGSLR